MLLLDLGRRRWRFYLAQLIFLIFAGTLAAAPFTWAVDGFVRSTSWDRVAFSVGSLAFGIALILAIRFFGTRYVTRLERQDDDLHISTFGMLTRERSLTARVADVVVGSRIEGYMRSRGQTVHAPWRNLWLPGYRLPFILDLQAPVLGEQTIAQLGSRLGS